MLQTLYPKAHFPGRISVINQDNDIKKALFNLQHEAIVGFDTETRPSFKKGEQYLVSLLQLASDEHALLFRLNKLSDFSEIKNFLENDKIKKVGVAIRDDINGLKKIFSFHANNFIELADLAEKNNIKSRGLKGMTEETLMLSLSKKAKLSNWEGPILKPDQVQYAATDAWIGKKIYEKLTASS